MKSQANPTPHDRFVSPSSWPAWLFMPRLTAFTRRGLTAALLTAALGVWTTAAPANPLGQAGPSWRKLRVESATVASGLQRQGAQLVADYGSFQILAAPAATAAARVAAGGAEWADDLDVIELNAGPLRTSQSEVQALRQALPAFSGKRLHLVQFAGPVKPEWHADLLASGVAVVAYVPNNAYLIYGDATALGLMQAWAAVATPVQWEGAFRDEYKLHPDVRLTDARGNPRTLPDDLFVIQMVADAEANAATLAAIEARRLAPVMKQENVLNYLNVIVRLPATELAALAAQPDVVSIWPYVLPKQRDERQGQIIAGNLAGTQPTGPGYLAWLASKGFTQSQFAASGLVVDVSDSGLDNGTATPGHFGLYTTGNTGLVSRVAYNRLVGTPHTGGTIQGCDGHGTLNSHIIAGYNDFSGFPFKDSSGYSYGLGIAPFVRVGSSVIFDPNSFTSPNYASLQSQAYRDGARISANSWGANTAGGYNTDAQSYDALVRDAQPAGSTVPAAGNQEMVIVFAAGNAGPSSGSVGAPGTAKNVITVGAAENVHSHSTANGGNNASGNDGCDDTDAMANSANDMSDFSSRGPCADGRKKPDIVAPGVHITGGVAQVATPGVNGTALACFDATGVCALPGSGTIGSANNFFPLGQQFYTTSAGTSHSTPAVAGGAALVRQWFINQSLTPPSPALTKAWLMNSARYLDGTFANDTLPSDVQGLGSMNLGMAFDDAARIVMEESPAEKFTASGQTRTIVGSVPDPARPFRITLAWTDAPGSTTGNAYNNNLNLVVTIGGQTYRGNVFTGAYSSTGGSADARNNVESVFLPAGLTGNFIATITAANIVSDGVPNDADLLDQDFALVIYNAQLRDAPVISTDGAALTAESCAPGNGVVDPGEVVSVAFSLKNVGTGTSTNLMATLLPTGGVLSPSAPQSYGELLPGGLSGTQTFSFQAVGACGDYILCSLHLTDGGADLGIVSFPLRLGNTTPANGSGSNPTAIAIPTGGAATPYPSPITIAGLTGQISKVTASVFGFSHTWPGDVTMLLVGPGGQSVQLLSGIGSGTDAVGANLTFDDAAPTSVPATIVSGTYQPTSSGTVALPTPAPAPPYGTTLSALNGSAANGDWYLYVYDRITPDGGSISGGWSLDVTTEEGVCCLNSSHADLGVTVQAQPNPGAWESDVTYTITIANGGLGAAAGVMVTNLLANEVSYASANVSQGTVSHAGGVVVASLGNLAAGASATLQIVATVNFGTGLTNVVTASTPTFDYDPNNNRATTLTVVNPPVLGISSQIYLVAESCGVGNGVPDPSETVTMNLVLQNTGTRKTTNVVVTLDPTGGVTSPGAPKNYGALLPGGPPVTNSFTFVAQADCGSLLTTTFNITDIGAALLTTNSSFRVGLPVLSTFETFDGVTVPALPAGWSAILTGTGPGWVTTAADADTPPNAAFASDPNTDSEKFLISAPFPVVGQAQVIFRQSYTTESCCDGGTLDISINGGPFTDILDAGGSFVSGGYNADGWWAGNSGGFITTVANLPASANGQSVQLRWWFTSDSSVGSVGWYVDSITLLAGYSCCVADDLALTASDAPDPAVVGQNLTYTLGVTNSGPTTGTSVTISNLLPASVSFVSAAVSQGTWSRNGNLVVAQLGNVGGGAGAGLSLVVVPQAAGLLTNVAVVKRDGTESYTANNTVVTLTTVNQPVLNLASQVYLTAESCGAGNGVPDPGENVTVKLVLQNTGTRLTTNVVVNLLPTGGVTSPSGAQSYGALLPGGPPVTNAFSFVAEGTCGSLLLTSFGVADGADPLTVVNNSFRIGVPVELLAQNFDGVTAPILPVGWAVAATNAGPNWATTAALADTLPNSVFVPNTTTNSDKQLLSPTLSIGGVAQLSFHHYYSTESGYDGGRLEISINGGAFTDIIAAGGSFVSGGYNATLGSVAAWTGNSGGFITTVVNLPASVVGQTARLRWHFTSDSSVAAVGWYVDTVSLRAGYSCCVTEDLALSATASPDPALTGQPLTYTLGVTNSGPSLATGVTISNFLPASVNFVSATASQGTWSRNGNLVVASLGSVGGGLGAGLSIVVTPTTPGTLTNLAIVRRDGAEGFLGNNVVETTTTVTAPTVETTFTAPTPVSIPSSGAGSPYPSTLDVSGIAGTVTKVTATLINLNHTYPDDLDILLVGPGGQKTMLMSDCGGSPDLVNVTLTFDDAASAVLPDGTQISSGTYRPTDYVTGDVLPAPAPAGPYGASLAPFQGVNPNGTWQLFIYDDVSGDSGSLSGGWRLTLTTTVPPPPMVLHATLDASGILHLSFDSLAGLSYTLQYKKQVDDPDWNSMTPVTGTGSTMTIQDPTAGESQRIYRLRAQ